MERELYVSCTGGPSSLAVWFERPKWNWRFREYTTEDYIHLPSLRGMLSEDDGIVQRAKEKPVKIKLMVEICEDAEDNADGSP